MQIMTTVGKFESKTGVAHPVANNIQALKHLHAGTREINIAWFLEDYEDVFEDQLPGPRVGAEIVGHG